MTASQSRGASRAGRPSKSDAEAVDGRLLDAAETLFLDHGFDGASVAAVAALAGASKQTIYQRYPTKAHLFEAVVERAMKRFLGGLQGTISGRTIEARIRHLATSFVDRMLEPRTLGLMRALIVEAGRSGELAQAVDRDAHRRIEQFIVDSGELDALVDESHGCAKRAVAARQFMDVTVNPLVFRALLGADVAILRREARRAIRENVALFIRGFGTDRRDDSTS